MQGQEAQVGSANPLRLLRLFLDDFLKITEDSTIPDFCQTRRPKITLYCLSYKLGAVRNRDVLPLMAFNWICRSKVESFHKVVGTLDERRHWRTDFATKTGEMVQ